MDTMREILQPSWSRCWGGFAAAGGGASLLQQLLAAWREPQRKYHTLQHLTECLTLLERHRDVAEHPAEVEIALWFHDAVYDVRGGDNEAKSADWAAREMAAGGARPESIERVRSLIMATCHAALPEGQDQKLLVDIDLSILGAPRPRFEEYEAQVREEYGWVPGWMFRFKRRGVLKEFLNREPIYGTVRLRELLETQARANLEYSIERLGG